jgi:Flp pilus assembly protein TadG
MVEMAIVLSVLLLLVFGMIDVGLMIKDSLAVSHLAKDAARDYAVGSSQSTITARIMAFAPAVGMDVSKLDTPLYTNIDAQHVEVTLTYHHETIAGGLVGLNNIVSLTGTGIHLKE